MGQLTLLHGADFHLGLERYGEANPATGVNSRIVDFERTLDRFVKECLSREVAMAVIAGDSFHTRRPGAYELAVFGRSIRLLVDSGIDVLIDPGNHDGMSTVGHADSHSLRWVTNLASERLHVLLDAGVTTVTTRAGPVHVAHMPYAHKRAFDDLLRIHDPEDRVIEAGKRVENLIRAYSDVAADVTMPTIFVGHVSVFGSQLGSEQAMRMGWDVVVSANVFDGFDYAALGHIHRQQQVSPKAWYAGSPDYHLFEDAAPGIPRGFLHVTVQPGAEPLVEPVAAEPRKMGVLPLEQKPDGSWPGTGPAAWYASGPIIRVVLKATVQRPAVRVTEDIVADLLKKGASYAEVVVDSTALPEHRPRVDMRADDRADGGFVGPEEALARWITANELPMEPMFSVGKEIIGLVRAREAEQVAGGESA